MNMLSREAAPVFNAGLAVLAAAAVAFFIFAMPADLFADLVGATGISAFVPAAQPPHGFTARVAAMAVVGLVIFSLVWALLRRIDALGDETAEPESEAGSILPRLRRADAHPDAPARRPLFAEADLGEPMPAPAEGADEPTPPVEESPIAEAPVPLEGTDVAESVVDVPVGIVAEAPTLAVEPRPPVAKDDDGATDGDTAPSNEELMERLPLPEDSGESISILFRRLETGLANCEWPLRPSEKPEDARPQARATVDDQLRSALDDLKRMAGR